MCAATGCAEFAVSEFLSPDDLRDMTERQHKDAQAKALEAAGIPFRFWPT